MGSRDRDDGNARPQGKLVEDFIQAAEAVAPDKWSVLYTRYATDRTTRRAVNKLDEIACTVLLRKAGAAAIARGGGRDLATVRITERLVRIAAQVPDEPAIQYTKTPTNLRAEVQKLLLSTRIILDELETLRRDPECWPRLKKLIALYDGVLSFPDPGMD